MQDFDVSQPMDAARAWLTMLMPHLAQAIEEASDRSIKGSMDSAYVGGWTEFSTTGYKLVFWPSVAD